MAAQRTKRTKLVDVGVGLNLGDDDDEILTVQDKAVNETAVKEPVIEEPTEPKKQTPEEQKDREDHIEKSASKISDADNSTDNSASDLDVDHSADSVTYQVVARRYRPKTFDELVGQTHISQALANAITTNRIGHAYLFTGARGVGKTSTARIFSKSLNCVLGATVKPCGECDSCVGISTGEDIDVLEIDGASNRGIDEIRQLRLNASICPSRSRFKIYIIDEVHMLTREAFNALLKILEEPPAHVKFIFCTTEPSKIPVTILSRCQRYDFAGIETQQISRHLASIAANEGVTTEDGVCELLARRAAGSMRDAQSLLEQLLSFAPQRIALTDVHDMLGTANDQMVFRLLESITGCEIANIFAELEVAISEGVDLTVLVEQMLGLFRDLLVIVSGGNASLMIFCTSSHFEQAVKYANTFGVHRILAAIQILDQTYSRMRYNTQTRVLTELALVRIAYLDNFQMVSVLLDKLRKGEVQINLPEKKTTNLTNEAITAANSPQKTPQRPLSPPTQNAPPTNKPINKPTTSEANQETASTISPQVSSQVSPRVWSVELDEIDGEKATEIWRSAIDSVDGFLGSSALIFSSVQFEKPDTFIVVFKNSTTKEYCERELARLRAAVCQTVGKTVQLRLTHEETKQQQSTTKTTQPQPRTSQETRAIFESAAKNSLVQEISNLFRTELIDAR